jgi:type II secretory pathway pseudopilin PulG
VVVGLGVVGAVGIVIGRGLAYQSSRGGESGIFGAALLLGLAVVAVLAAAIGWLVVSSIRKRRGQERSLLAGLGVLLAGAIVGNATAAATGGTVVEPVTLRSSATIVFSIRADDGPATDAGGAGRCESGPDQAAVTTVTELDLGELDGASLRGSISVSGQDVASVDLFIDGGDLSGEEPAPAWNCVAAVTVLSDRMQRGAIEFDAEIVPPDPRMPSPTRTWPGRLSGTIEWTCGALLAGSHSE